MPHTLLAVFASGLFAVPGAAQDPYDAGPYAEDRYTDAAYAADEGQYVADDSLEARVWLDRGADAVVEQGDEVRVYYRTSHDAYAAIFRIDTDGRISLVYPQHPDADPYVVGRRDYRLVFPEGARWRVREDPGVGYFFMVASYQPLDFSLFGFDADDGWDLRGVGETVYEDPYVAIDDYVAAILPQWETAGYALDFLEYNVDEEHDYPRFLCYDCHDYRPYSRWDPYAGSCSSFQVVIWDDPYFYPRFRYVGTRVVFARPIGPRPRYSVTARLVGSGPRPIVRSRPAPPPRIAAYKEAPRRVAPGRGVAPSRAGTARSGPAATRRQPPLPSARRGVPPTVRGTPAAGASSRGRERPTLQRRPPPRPSTSGQARPSRAPSPSGRVMPIRPPRSGAGAAPGRTPRSAPRAAPTRTPRAGPRAQPTRNPRSGPRAAPPRPPRSGPRAAPSRPPRSGSSARPTRRPRSGGDAQPARQPRSSGRATPSRPPRTSGAASPAPSRRPGGSAAPSRGAARSRPPAGTNPRRRPGG